MNDESKNIPMNVKEKICAQCEYQGTCSEPLDDNCKRMLIKYQNMTKMLGYEEINGMDAIGIYRACVDRGIKGLRLKQSRDYYISKLYEDGYISYETLVKLSNDAVNKGHSPIELIKPAEDAEKRSIDVIDEMIVLFGIADVITFCRLNAWVYRKKASFNDSEYAEEADRYIKIAHELQQIREYRGDWKLDCIPDRS